jgi:starvation-inducible outer membrane lipoprotein
MNVKKTSWWAWVLSPMLIGAASPPVIPPEIFAKTAALTYERVSPHPDRYIGQHVLSGGPILAIARQKDQTLLRILQLTLDSHGEPKNPEISENRFVVHLPPYLQLPKAHVGLRVTVLGQVLGRKSQSAVSGQTGSCPVLLAESIYEWPVPPKQVLPDEGSAWPGSYWDYGGTRPEWKDQLSDPR